MPYRIDIDCPPADAFDILVQLGALDIEPVGEGLGAILPDDVTQESLAAALGGATLSVSDAVGRDSDSVWLLSARAVRVGNVLIASPGGAAPANALRLTDSAAFGTGHHPTTALCMEALEEMLASERPDSMLDVGTGSGILALAALRMGVPRAVGLDIDAAVLQVAAENARLNHLAERLQLIHGGPSDVNGTWPLIVANLLAAPLIAVAPVLVRRVAKSGRLILSGIQWSLATEVRQAYEYFGMRHAGSKTRAGWTVVVMQAGW